MILRPNATHIGSYSYFSHNNANACKFLYDEEKIYQINLDLSLEYVGNLNKESSKGYRSVSFDPNGAFVAILTMKKSVALCDLMGKILWSKKGKSSATSFVQKCTNFLFD